MFLFYFFIIDKKNTKKQKNNNNKKRTLINIYMYVHVHCDIAILCTLQRTAILLKHVSIIKKNYFTQQLFKHDS